MLTGTQKRIMALTGAAFVTFIVCWFWMYVPARQKIKGLKDELQSIQDQIANIEGIVGASASAQPQGILTLKTEAEIIEARFPSQEEESLTLLSSFAEASRLTVRSMQTMPKQAYGAPGGIDGKTCRRVQVSLEFSGSFANILHYLRKVKQELPGMTLIETLTLRKRSVTQPVLDVSMTLNLYLLS